MKCPLWPIAAKLESAGTKTFLREVDQELWRWKSICQILILIAWLVTMPCFLPKIAQIVQKGVKVGPKVLTWVVPFRVLLLVRILANLDHLWRSKGLKTSQKRLFAAVIFCPLWLIFFENLFYRKQCKYAMNIGVAQIRGALSQFIVVKKCSFVSLPDTAFHF